MEEAESIVQISSIKQDTEKNNLETYQLVGVSNCGLLLQFKRVVQHHAMGRNTLTSHELEGLGLDGLIGVGLRDGAAHFDGRLFERIN